MRDALGRDTATTQLLNGTTRRIGYTYEPGMWLRTSVRDDDGRTGCSTATHVGAAICSAAYSYDDVGIPSGVTRVGSGSSFAQGQTRQLVEATRRVWYDERAASSSAIATSARASGLTADSWPSRLHDRPSRFCCALAKLSPSAALKPRITLSCSTRCVD